MTKAISLNNYNKLVEHHNKQILNPNSDASFPKEVKVFQDQYIKFKNIAEIGLKQISNDIKKMTIIFKEFLVTSIYDNNKKI